MPGYEAKASAVSECVGCLGMKQRSLWLAPSTISSGGPVVARSISVNLATCLCSTPPGSRFW